MVAYVCVDTKTGFLRRYVRSLLVPVGAPKFRCTHTAKFDTWPLVDSCPKEGAEAFRVAPWDLATLEAPAV